MYRKVLPTVIFLGRLGSSFFDCISTRTTSIGWFHALRPPPRAEARIFSGTESFWFESVLPVKERIPFSLRHRLE
jgi:hypothetical protein